jgi:hypothetical protein
VIAALGVIGSQFVSAQQQPIKRIDLLKSELPEIQDNEMHVWVADIAPSAATGDTLIQHRGSFMSSKVLLSWS